MNKSASPRKLSRKLLIFFALLLGSFLIYAASIGPAIWLNKRGIITVETLATLYFPLNLVAEMIPGSGALIESYLRLWIEE